MLYRRVGRVLHVPESTESTACTGEYTSSFVFVVVHGEMACTGEYTSSFFFFFTVMTVIHTACTSGEYTSSFVLVVVHMPVLRRRTVVTVNYS